ncbi:ATP-binding protein [Pseudomonas sp. RIT-To-2]|uniref:ATP-binding protein n=1 Tax=Pseudomonas sp. RIT-To-2 TaxID=3462541 RepID=UPI00241389D7
MTSGDTSAALAQATANCAKEPIHLPGSIQPHGFMLVLEPDTLAVLQASENIQRWLGEAAEQWLGRYLPELLQGGEQVARLLAERTSEEHKPVHVADVRFAVGNYDGPPIALMVHRFDSVLIAEFEPASDVLTAYANLYPLVRTFIGQLQGAESIEQVCAQAVAEVKRITGFGRVKAYRFDEAGDGLVLAELADEGYPSYLGLCFPAADIPPQARALYCANRIRVIEDANYVPAALVPALNPLTERPLDLSYAALRSVSPVHLHYMRNMRTLASMSISIVVGGRLWGLISCHHAEPRAVRFQSRTACELLGSVLSLQIESMELHVRNQRLLGVRQQIVQLLSVMADRDSVRDGALALSDTLLGFARAQGAAIITASSCDLVGETPDEAMVLALTEWLAERGGHEVFHSDNVGRDIPSLPGLAAQVGGVLAVAISEIHSHYLIWFKPEQARSVVWAGKPEKSISDSGVLNPRHSFDSWQETVKGYSSPWDPLEIEGVAELRTAVLGIVLRKAEELAQLAGELKRSNKELEAFSYSVSHDLRAPLRHIAGYAELLGDFEGEKLSERGQRFLDHIGESARFAGSLVDNLLSFSQMGRSALRLSDVDLGALVEAIREEMLPDYDDREVQWRIEPLPRVLADAAFLHLALRNLISNALKYSRGSNPAVIEIGATEQNGETVVYVRDNGVGFDMEYVDKLFGVFQRLHRMEEFEGTGIGLASVRRIIERHDGRVWAQGVLGEGATFSFALPHAPARNPA